MMKKRMDLRNYTFADLMKVPLVQKRIQRYIDEPKYLTQTSGGRRFMENLSKQFPEAAAEFQALLVGK